MRKTNNEFVGKEMKLAYGKKKIKSEIIFLFSLGNGTIGKVLKWEKQPIWGE
jgi:hypothetical protein